MPLKVRLVVSIAAALLLALVAGGALLCWHARNMAAAEVQSAFRGAAGSLRDTLEGDVQHTVTMRQVIAGFNGQRHVRLALLNEKGRAIVTSSPAAPLRPAPGWFAALIAPAPLSARIPIALPHYPCVLLLRSESRNEVAEMWVLARDAFTAMLIFSAVSLLLVWIVAGRALRFMGGLQGGLGTVSRGDYAARLAVEGPPEFAALARGFNHMAARLAAYAENTRRLEQQILSVQEEERAGIARDLHDEVGPYLFAIQVDADALAASGAGRERAAAIRDAAQHIQRVVKALLRQLRPVGSLDFGLEAAIADTIAFWSRRHPAIRFEPDVAADTGLDRRGEEAVFRIVQESLSNAVRHGKPHRIRVTVARQADGVRVEVDDDGAGLAQAADGPGHVHMGHMGLSGMAERVAALGGRFRVDGLAEGGVRVSAFLPRRREMEPA